MRFNDITVATVAVFVLVAAGAMGVGATTGHSPDTGFLPTDESSSSEPTTANTGAHTHAHPTGTWTQLIDDGHSDDEPALGIDTVHVQHDADTLYFKTQFHGTFDNRSEIDLAFFLDSDQDQTTGLNNESPGWYYMDGIGADYAAVAGQEGDGIWQWDNSQAMWTQNQDEFAYIDYDYVNDTVVVGIDRTSIGNPDAVDLLVGNALTSPWDYAPDRDAGHLTYTFDQQTTPGPEAAFTVNASSVAAGETVAFDASASSGTIAAYNWDFDGDGVTDATRETPTVTHQYDEAGEYDPTLTVVTESGATASTTKAITVTAGPDDGDAGNDSAGAVVSLAPAEPTVAPGGATTVDVVVENTGEIAAYEFNASVSNATTLQIDDITLHGSPASVTQEVSIAADGSAASAEAALASVDPTDGAVIADVTLTATGATPGSLAVDVTAVGDSEGNAYNISDGTASASVSVQAGPGDVTGNGNAATDPDGDGTYEDINGDGSANVLDVQAFFQNLGSEAVTDNTAFDINGDGTVDILDIQTLFTETS